jgi:predicted GNAT family acetyltransferase
MIKIKSFADVKAFQSHVQPMLLRRECENCIFLGVIQRMTEGKSPIRGGGETVPLLLSVERDGEVIAVALQTPPHAMNVSWIGRDEAGALANYLGEIHWPRTELSGPSPAIELLASSLGRYEVIRQLRVFQLDKVISPKPIPGRMRRVREDEAELLGAWIDQFDRDIGEHPGDGLKTAQFLIAEGRPHFWDDGIPRAVASFSGPTPHGIRVNLVFTPPGFRGRGFASNLVATLSQKLLDEGRKFCFLFTDQANPTSNSIYQKLGYQPVADYSHLRFA